MEKQESQRVVEEFWTAMDANDFRSASNLLYDDFILEWPQSGERIRGRENFIAVNENYPAEGRWSFTIHRLLTDGNEVITEVTVTDGVRTDRVITFSTVREDQIIFQIEYWPEYFEPAEWRTPWVENMEKAEGPARMW